MHLAWHDRQYWPPALKQRIGDFNLERVWEFIGKAIAASRAKCYGDDSWAVMAGLGHDTGDPDMEAWRELVLEAGAAADEDPASAKAQSLAARWSRLDPVRVRTSALAARWKELARRTAPSDDAIARQIAIFHLEKLMGFVGKASYCRFQRYDALYREVEQALGEDPGSEKGQALAACWEELQLADGEARRLALNAAPTRCF
jgi:hypothetical protein